MTIKHPWLILLAVLIILAAGCAVIEIRDLPMAGNSTTVLNGTVNSGSAAGSCDGNTGTCSLPATGNTTYRTITDMAGRTVTLPANISMVLCTSPPPTTFVYMLAPEKLGSVSSNTTNATGQNLTSLSSTLSGSMKSGSTNYEAYIAMHPDLVFISCESGLTDPSATNLTQEKFGTIPVVCVDNARNATGYGPTLLFMGDILGVPDVAKEEDAYYQKVLDEVQTKVATIPEGKRVRVYYAEGTDGLSTDPSGSCHSQLIDVCGGINVATCEVSSGSGMTGITKESVLMWKPDIIISSSKDFIAQAYNDSTWQRTPAVQNHRVYLIPTEPYNWFDRPPGVNRIVGIPWTAHILYPDLFPDDWFRAKAKEFYSLFYHIDLSDEDLDNVLAQQVD